MPLLGPVLHRLQHLSRQPRQIGPSQPGGEVAHHGEPGPGMERGHAMRRPGHLPIAPPPSRREPRSRQTVEGRWVAAQRRGEAQDRGGAGQVRPGITSPRVRPVQDGGYLPVPDEHVQRVVVEVQERGWRRAGGLAQSTKEPGIQISHRHPGVRLLLQQRREGRLMHVGLRAAEGPAERPGPLGMGAESMLQRFARHPVQQHRGVILPSVSGMNTGHGKASIRRGPHRRDFPLECRRLLRPEEPQGERRAALPHPPDARIGPAAHGFGVHWRGEAERGQDGCRVGRSIWVHVA